MSCGCACPKCNACLDDDLQARCKDTVTGTALVVEMKQTKAAKRTTAVVYCGACQVWVECDCPQGESNG
jgi:hypothetical protein